jgi:hypothetical protein
MYFFMVLILSDDDIHGGLRARRSSWEPTRSPRPCQVSASARVLGDVATPPRDVRR